MRPRARAPSCPLATPLSFCPVFRFAPPSPTVRTSLLLSDDVCRRCNLAFYPCCEMFARSISAPMYLGARGHMYPTAPPTLRLCCHCQLILMKLLFFFSKRSAIRYNSNPDVNQEQSSITIILQRKVLKKVRGGNTIQTLGRMYAMNR